MSSQENAPCLLITNSLPDHHWLPACPTPTSWLLITNFLPAHHRLPACPTPTPCLPITDSFKFILFSGSIKAERERGLCELTSAVQTRTAPTISPSTCLWVGSCSGGTLWVGRSFLPHGHALGTSGQTFSVAPSVVTWSRVGLLKHFQTQPQAYSFTK